MEFVENRVFEAAPGVFVRNAVDNCAWVDLGSGVATIDALEDPQMAPVIQHVFALEVDGKPTLAFVGFGGLAAQRTKPAEISI